MKPDSNFISISTNHDVWLTKDELMFLKDEIERDSKHNHKVKLTLQRSAMDNTITFYGKYRTVEYINPHPEWFSGLKPDVMYSALVLLKTAFIK